MEDVRREAEHLGTVGGPGRGTAEERSGRARAGTGGLSQAASSVEDILNEWNDLSSPGPEGGVWTQEQSGASPEQAMALAEGGVATLMGASRRVAGLLERVAGMGATGEGDVGDVGRLAGGVDTRRAPQSPGAHPGSDDHLQQALGRVGGSGVLWDVGLVVKGVAPETRQQCAGRAVEEGLRLGDGDMARVAQGAGMNRLQAQGSSALASGWRCAGRAVGGAPAERLAVRRQSGWRCAGRAVGGAPADRVAVRRQTGWRCAGRPGGGAPADRVAVRRPSRVAVRRQTGGGRGRPGGSALAEQLAVRRQSGWRCAGRAGGGAPAERVAVRRQSGWRCAGRAGGGAPAERLAAQVDGRLGGGEMARAARGAELSWLQRRNSSEPAHTTDRLGIRNGLSRCADVGRVCVSSSTAEFVVCGAIYFQHRCIGGGYSTICLVCFPT
ncbi:hypothetical protein CYMTET_26827 [Cymbomonas tetramitiformis]|uniref:Uncharacterized protein n=1 Tax=Cymbomonas tetramitiformis TaxID=36881 RepID=A0AAE0FRL9_9CHLO|nr:hypothetical protein CYMTET_26827 [Cymbomonas tetramitiformis]